MLLEMQTRYFYLTDFKRRENGFQVNPRFKQYTQFLYKNHFYKNVEAEINQHFKNALRTFLRLRVD